MTSTWLKWLPCKILTRWLFKNQNHHIFWSSAFSVHFRYKVHMSFQDHLSCQGHLLSKESIDFLGHCSSLLGKVKDKSFKYKLTKIVTWAFWYFWFQCKVNGKIGIWSPVSSYMCCKGTQNWFFGPNLFFHGNFKSYHTSTGSQMFSNVKGHMSIILKNWTCI